MTAPLYVITGAMAAGKSTIAKALVQRFEKSAHVGGDGFLRMIIKGGAVMGPELSPEAFGAFIASENRKWGEVIRRNNISAD